MIETVTSFFLMLYFLMLTSFKNAVLATVAATATLFIVGCAVGPNYKTPAVSLPDRFAGAPGLQTVPRLTQRLRFLIGGEDSAILGSTESSRPPWHKIWILRRQWPGLIKYKLG
ncbi:hypothetical protein ABK905_05250 [Acerihabitans sp. KWT182]|uniref:Uncharacterized protein n=1 Tax=Acerihabitans sp. KWT182 TaxID=3157919 RepID=A0AAU7QBU5_9GAMM